MLVPGWLAPALAAYSRNSIGVELRSSIILFFRFCGEILVFCEVDCYETREMNEQNKESVSFFLTVRESVS